MTWASFFEDQLVWPQLVSFSKHGYWHCRFVQFGPEVKCHCGASTCQGYLGTKKKIPKLPQLPNWGAKRRRTPTASLRIIRS